MASADLIAELRRQAPDIRALGATSLYLFGSAARGEAAETSDVDLFIDYDPDRFSFVELVRLRERLSEVLGHTPISPPARGCIRFCAQPSSQKPSGYSR